jgi:hypothetical protein
VHRYVGLLGGVSLRSLHLTYHGNKQLSYRPRTQHVEADAVGLVTVPEVDTSQENKIDHTVRIVYSSSQEMNFPPVSNDTESPLAIVTRQRSQ